MDTAELIPVFQSSGPFATVLVDVSHDTENGEHEHELRVRAACEQLREQGADDSAITLVEERLTELVTEPAPTARVVVASADGVAYDRTARAQADHSVATWAPLPDLGAWIEHRDSAVTFVLALVDHKGGDVAVYDSDVPQPEAEATVGGEELFVHQVPVGGWSALRYQHNTENIWGRNADAVVDQVTAHVRNGHRLVLLAGDPQSVGMVRDGLSGTEAEVVVLDTGQRAEDGGDEALSQAIREALMDHVVRRRLGATHRLREQAGRGQAATGLDEVADAFVRGQVDLLLLDPAAASGLELDVSKHPGLDLGEGTDGGPVRADLGLVSAAVRTGAGIMVTGSGALGAPVAALLRWEQ